MVEQKRAHSRTETILGNVYVEFEVVKEERSSQSSVVEAREEGGESELDEFEASSENERESRHTYLTASGLLKSILMRSDALVKMLGPKIKEGGRSEFEVREEEGGKENVELASVLPSSFTLFSSLPLPPFEDV